MYCDLTEQSLVGKHGVLDIPDGDEVTRKLAMLIEGECEGLGPVKAARKFGFSKARYFQLRQSYQNKEPVPYYASNVALKPDTVGQVN